MNTTTKSRILINPRGLNHVGGVARWARLVLAELSVIQEVHLVKPWGIETENHFITRASENFIIPLLIRKNDLLLSLCNWGPIIENQVIVIHDVAPLVHPEFFSRNYVHFANTILPRLIRKSSKVLTVSEFTKREIVRIFDTDANKISVVGASSTIQDFQNERIELATQNQRSSSSYMLFLGAHDPRKNLEFILNIWEEIYEQTGMELIAIGQSVTKVFAVTSNKEIRGVKYIEQVTNSELKYWISNAKCLLSPSHYEGFGLPIIESLLEGTPVISSMTGIAMDVISPGLQILELESNIWKNAILNHEKFKFIFNWNSWLHVAENIADELGR
jgi:glycosyltransferase involved in cell wall biosynthesis